IRLETLDRQEIKTIPLTISIGIGSFAGPGVTLDETIRAADAALYRAKAGGRNRIERETSNRL
ncbi:MAG: diguanylate cyclase, partial [Pseudomonadota bacterium]